MKREAFKTHVQKTNKHKKEAASLTLIFAVLLQKDIDSANFLCSKRTLLDFSFIRSLPMIPIITKTSPITNKMSYVTITMPQKNKLKS